MKKIVLTFGLIAGVILAAMMLLTVPFQDEIGSGHSYLIGYTTMVVAFLLIYFGVRSYRDNVAGGTVGFGRALAVGVLIGAVASACYVAAWEVYFFRFAPDFLTKYNAHVLETARANGESAEALAKRKVDMEGLEKMYANPVINSAMTFAEPFPVALIVSLVSAGVLSRRRKTWTGQGDAIPGPGTPATR
jgi:Protein of unknown function (DUF4199)